MKPAEQSAVCGAHVDGDVRGSRRAAGRSQFSPRQRLGHRAASGRSSRMSMMIAFTGSREVGLRIWEIAGKTRPGQRELKRVVCEMGGKNADHRRFRRRSRRSDRRLDLLRLRISGPKMFRALAADRARRKLRSRDRAACSRPQPVCASAIRKNRASRSARSSTRRAYKRILEMIEIGKTEATLAYQAKDIPKDGLLHSADDFHRRETESPGSRAKKFSARS